MIDVGKFAKPVRSLLLVEPMRFICALVFFIGLAGAANAQSPTSCSVLTQAQLLNEFQSCSAQGLPAGCLTAENVRDVICSISNIAGAGAAGPVPTMASTGFSSFTTTQGTATIADTPVGVSISDKDTGADTIRAACKSSPATPYTVTGKFALNSYYDQNGADSWGGFAWRDANTGKIIGYGILSALLSQTAFGGTNGTPTVYSINFNSPTNFASTSNGFATTWSTTIWLQMSDDGTNVTQRFSMDGANFININVAKFSNYGTGALVKSTGFLGASGYNQVCMFVSAHGSDAEVSMQAYSQTSP